MDFSIDISLAIVFIVLCHFLHAVYASTSVIPFGAISVGNLLSLLSDYISPQIARSLEYGDLEVVKESLLEFYNGLVDVDSHNSQISARGWIGFPSLEGALLSLAFLTFSVFLIDLIQTMLSRLPRTTTVAPMGGTGGTGVGRLNDKIINPVSNSGRQFSYENYSDNKKLKSSLITQAILSASKKYEL